jgi:superfamily I DNA/RNA helicase
MIIAGPGTGKTKTLTHRIAHLIATFHSLCLKILQEQENFPQVSVIDDDERRILILEAIKEVKKKGLKISEKPKVLLDKIVSAKQQIQGPEDDLKEFSSEKNTEVLIFVYRAYQKLLFTQKLCDFEDLIYEVVKLLEKNNSIKNEYIKRFKFIFVDEYQDINHGQYRIIKALAPPDNPNTNLCVIGDPDQSIYGFRGSDVRYFSRFSQEYPQTKLISLKKITVQQKPFLKHHIRLLKIEWETKIFQS